MDDKESVALPSITALMKDSEAMNQILMRPLENSDPRVNEVKIRRLYLQASAQQWFAPQKLDYDMPINLTDEQRRVWARFHLIFYTLEKMGLNVIQNMMSKASAKLRSDEVASYLSVQAADEARHVFAIEAYLRKLGTIPKYDHKYHVLGRAASMGLYRVENWLFSTLFSENFASCFLRQAKNADIDPLGAELCRMLIIDESRHIHFLNIVLPDIMERLSLLGKTYVRSSQFFIMKFTELVSRSLEVDARLVGLDRRALLEDAFENVERSYEAFGVSRRFLPFPTIRQTVTI